MNDNDEYYRELNLRVGLEIHQQLDTHKLFCSCPSILTDNYENRVIRKLRPTQSELGDVDIAAVQEAKKKLIYTYEVPETTCLVELDEEPPHEPNREAISIALMIARMVNARIVDEINFMRKVVIDGSNTTGFQRTALIAIDGRIDDVKIDTICLEEDACRKIRIENGNIVYRLDRLGIPLIEITTAPDISSPEKTKDIAKKIGLLLRSTKKVKRGIGTIRQDLNVSIRDGARVEIKGVQDLRGMPDVIKKEISRQLKLIEIKNKLKNVNDIKGRINDVTDIFRNTKCKIIKKMIECNGVVLCLKLEYFSGLMGTKDDNWRLGREFAEIVKPIGIKGIFHSDELPAYGISQDEIKKIERRMDIDKVDGFVIIAENREKAEYGLKIILERARQCKKGVPSEVRHVLPDNTTEFMRPMPGSARMYPETDIPPVKIDRKTIDTIELPEKYEDKITRFVSEYKINREIATQLVFMGYDDEFEYFVNMGYEPSIVSRIYLHILPELDTEGVNIDKVNKCMIEDILREIKKEKFAKEGICEILRCMIEKDIDIEKALDIVGFSGTAETDVEKTIEDILNENIDLIKERGERSFSILMGIAMKKYRGKVDGKTIAKIIKTKLSQLVSE